MARLSQSSTQSKASRVPEGVVVYAIGDVHGRVDLLRDLLRQLEADIAAAPHLLVMLVMLGDYIDRGSDSHGVLDVLSRLAKAGGEQMISLKGNHEEALLNFIAEPETGVGWSYHGGRDTLASYGVSSPVGQGSIEEWTEARDQLAAALPADHLDFLNGLKLHATIGDYVFAHAGLRPGVALEDQHPHDLMWIRQAFLDAGPWTDQVVVHGHTPEPQPIQRPGRIGIDTGAYATGVLTALRLEGDDRRFLQTGAAAMGG